MVNNPPEHFYGRTARQNTQTASCQLQGWAASDGSRQATFHPCILAVQPLYKSRMRDGSVEAQACN